jgi:hypothetical protein
MMSVTQTYKETKKRAELTLKFGKKPVRSQIPTREHHNSDSSDPDFEPGPEQPFQMEQLKAELQQSIQQVIQQLCDELQLGLPP